MVERVETPPRAAKKPFSTALMEHKRRVEEERQGRLQEGIIR